MIPLLAVRRSFDLGDPEYLGWRMRCERDYSSRLGKLERELPLFKPKKNNQLDDIGRMMWAQRCEAEIRRLQKEGKWLQLSKPKKNDQLDDIGRMMCEQRWEEERRRLIKEGKWHPIWFPLFSHSKTSPKSTPNYDYDFSKQMDRIARRMRLLRMRNDLIKQGKPIPAYLRFI
ncbi:hypothetical protein TVAG_430820 [Trichomonas vaginalis G3]|uniref:Uncharacterized protein n=1 Tax=Trichomonas vaginalis (strain ATCC PRA-98 / G3) TaxID=412133 RepID=A2E3A5_TRIV3|nr:hypothetical protein TVAGG3_1017550 [Trichomonas vaginalis G3]EAY12915.1 hypothetical protein TVAG_430820 [Trichomonas vaginalis G3]KAI5491914.1 hypothetical protein TVAGG3_1017550 [Trichomonas vaginalis G3]|eukprot:XP_001325138.1 hypothetical protein [Trichomonas vaginalis G3]